MRALLLVLIPSLCFAQVFPPEGGTPVEVPAPAGSDHAGQYVLARSVTLSAPSGEAGVTLTSGAYFCLNETCTKKFYYDGSVIRIGGDIMIDSVVSSAMNIGNWITNGTSGLPLYINDPQGTRFECTSTLFGCGDYVPVGTLEVLCSDYSVYWCGPSGWETIATTGNTQLVNGDTIIGPHSVVAQAGVGEKGYSALHNSVWDVGTGSNDEFYSDGTLVHAGIWYFAQAGFNQFNPATGNRTTYVGSDGLRIYPVGTGGTCSSSSDSGTISAESATGRMLYCDGETGSNQVVALLKSWTGALDFAAVAAGTCAGGTVTSTGLAKGEPVVCGACADVVDADFNYSCNCYATAANTTTVQVCCNDTISCTDLDSINFTSTVIR